MGHIMGVHIMDFSVSVRFFVKTAVYVGIRRLLYLKICCEGMSVPLCENNALTFVSAFTLQLPIGRSLAQGNWLGPKVGGHLALFCIHQMNQVNSCNCCATMAAPQTSASVLSFQYYECAYNGLFSFSLFSVRLVLITAAYVQSQLQDLSTCCFLWKNVTSMITCAMTPAWTDRGQQYNQMMNYDAWISSACSTCFKMCTLVATTTATKDDYLQFQMQSFKDRLDKWWDILWINWPIKQTYFSKDDAEVTSTGKSFHKQGAVILKARLPATNSLSIALVSWTGINYSSIKCINSTDFLYSCVFCK